MLGVTVYFWHGSMIWGIVLLFTKSNHFSLIVVDYFFDGCKLMSSFTPSRVSSSCAVM